MEEHAEGHGGLGPRIIVSILNNEEAPLGLGRLFITETVFFGIIVAAIIAVVCIWMASGLSRVPSKRQVIAEFIVGFVYKMTKDTMGIANMSFAPYIGTIFIYMLFGNALGMFGFRPITADVNMTFALSTITFILIEFNSLRSMGFKRKFHHLCEPFPVYIGVLTMLPLKLIESVARPISLGFRLFGNIFGGLIVMELIFEGLGTLSRHLALPIPFFQALIPLPANVFFDIFEPVVQAYIFTMLTMIFISLEIIRTGDGEHH